MRAREAIFVLGLWTGLAAAGDAYEAGRAAFLAGDYVQAHRLWEQAARGPAPEPPAALGLGLLYEKGLGVARSPAQALAWYRLAARQGSPEAAYQVGLMLELGLGAAPDPWAAEAWYEKALGGEVCPGEIADPLSRIRALSQE